MKELVLFNRLRNKENEYIGTVEIVQDISELKLLEGDNNEIMYIRK